MMGWRAGSEDERCGIATERREDMYIITAMHNGRKITRMAFGDFQAFTIINQLAREGCVDIGMRKEDEQ